MDSIKYKINVKDKYLKNALFYLFDIEVTKGDDNIYRDKNL